MNVLALDLATRCGWALWENGRKESGVQVFDVKRGESPGMRYVAFNRWLNVMGRAHLSSAGSTICAWPDLIVYEAAHHRGGAATEVAVGLATRVQEFCAAHEIEHASVHSATLKKWTTGNGRAGKDEMVAHVQARFTAKRGLDDNEADAIALLEYARAELVPAP